jgi:hypothetical protein
MGVLAAIADGSNREPAHHPFVNQHLMLDCAQAVEMS